MNIPVELLAAPEADPDRARAFLASLGDAAEQVAAGLDQTVATVRNYIARRRAAQHCEITSAVMVAAVADVEALRGFLEKAALALMPPTSSQEA